MIQEEKKVTKETLKASDIPEDIPKRKDSGTNTFIKSELIDDDDDDDDDLDLNYS